MSVSQPFSLGRKLFKLRGPFIRATKNRNLQFFFALKNRIIDLKERKNQKKIKTFLHSQIFLRHPSVSYLKCFVDCHFSVLLLYCVILIFLSCFCVILHGIKLIHYVVSRVRCCFYSLGSRIY